jgi:radical SAM protein with 4Fe4S-binding SPASM domain
MSSYVIQVKALDKRVASKLGSLDIELTERCNNDCIHCCINLPLNDKKAIENEMSTGRIKDILIQAERLGCMRVRFTGGEPLLRPDFEELYIFARKLGIKVLVFTNARLINERLAGLFERIPPLVTIEITSYGMHPESYEAVTRAPGSFKQYRRGVDLLTERGIPFIIKSALLPENKHEIDEFEAWAGTIPWMTKKPNYSMFFDLRNRCDEQDKNALIRSVRVSPEDGLAVLTREAQQYRKNINEFASKFMGPPGDVLFRCGAGCGMCIDPYGMAQPCMGVRAPDLTYDTSKYSIETILDKFKALREMRTKNPEYLRRCAICFLKGLCEQCPAKSWSEHQTLDTPVEYLCETAHAQAKWMGWLSKEEKAWEVFEDWKARIGLSSTGSQ